MPQVRGNLRCIFETTVKNFSGIGGLNCSVFDENDVLLSNDNCSRTESEEFEAPTWRSSLNYTPLDGMLVYGSISTGYRAGGINLRGINNETLEPFDEETVTTFEIGHKTDWGLVSDLPLRTNFAVFYQEYEDIQKSVASTKGGLNFGTGAINAAEAVLQGAEFDLTWLATDDLVLAVGYSYLDAQYDSWDREVSWTGAPTGLIVDYSNANFTYVPRNTATASANYTLPVDPMLGDMSFYISVYWQDEMATYDNADALVQQAGYAGWSQENLDAALDTTETDSYAIWNVRFDWRSAMGSDFDAAVYVNNATDEEYVIGGLNVIDSLGTAAATYGEPRTIGASLRYNF